MTRRMKRRIKNESPRGSYGADDFWCWSWKYGGVKHVNLFEIDFFELVVVP